MMLFSHIYIHTVPYFSVAVEGAFHLVVGEPVEEEAEVLLSEAEEAGEPFQEVEVADGE
jgi:hypothetical protein